MAQARRWLISGRVQGVSFRWFTRQQANRLELVGTVKNLSDGRVEVSVAGSAGQVQDLYRLLQEGPRQARVSSIDEAPLEDAERSDLLGRPSFEMIF